MRLRAACAALLALLACALPAQAQTALPPDQAAIKAHVQFLASDALRGREAGTPDHDRAAEYVAAQMLAAGLRPAGEDGSWFQRVRLTRYQAADKPSWTLTRGDGAIPLQFGVDFITAAVPATPDFAASGEIVFAGYGLVYPAEQIDDYRGLDVRGKIVAILGGLPADLTGDVAAHLADDEQKARFAEARGAKAVIVLESAERRAEMPFESIVPFWNYPRWGWAGPDGRANMIAPGAPVVGYMGQTGAEKLFAGSAIRWRDVLAAERHGTPMPHGVLPGTLAVSTKTNVSLRQSRNVIGLLPGSDPALAGQYLVLSAHLDHVGVGQPVRGDSIYNGAMDNAVGVAMVIEAARALQASGKRPRRSILFVALTAEEKGLIGSDYFAHHPTVPQGALVANVNLDMPILTYKLHDLVILGGERSSLGPALTAAAATEGLATVPDPEPEEMFFVRSDHYSFVQSGIPAVSVDTGPGGEGAAAQRLFLDNHYHKPSDDLSLPFDWGSAAKYLRVITAGARAIADAPERPRWNRGDFFGVQFKGYGAE
ncbi:MAG TPA: M20/M25/M40 family metallo-hydrolase [Sphingomonas sp.]|nr:M20/M25/M40 family metallo-hydrolase [Sphingomonas sp.]